MKRAFGVEVQQKEELRALFHGSQVQEYVLMTHAGLKVDSLLVQPTIPILRLVHFHYTSMFLEILFQEVKLPKSTCREGVRCCALAK